MDRSIGRVGLTWVGIATTCWLLGSAGVCAQQPTTPPPAQEPFAGTALPQPAIPALTAPPVADAASSREAALEARIQQLEAMVNQLSYQVNNGAVAAPATAAPAATTAGMGGVAEDVGRTGGLTGGRLGGPGVPGHVKFGPGFEIATDDEEWIMQFHDLTQFDYRGYLHGGETLYHDGFSIPRQWWMWNGHVTKEIGYFVALAQGFDSVNALDVFVDFNYDRRLQIRAGRFKTPFTYEFFIEPIQGLITPERSLFFNNFGQNRDEGVMAYGQLVTNPDNNVSKIQYAAGTFNGNRNGFLPNQNGKFISSFLNFHPFGDFEGSLLESLNFGGSVFAGNQAQPAVPAVYRTIVATTGNATLGVPFLALGDHTMQSGPMAFWDMHLAWFYQQLAVVSEWQSGYQDYSLNTSQAARAMHTRVPVQSFYVLAGYLLTGETRSQFGIVKPFRPFSLRPGQFGPGAWEVWGRYNYLDIGSQIFSNGLAKTDGNANRVSGTELGLTWHMTQYVKMFFTWRHDEFNDPITFAPGKTPSMNKTQTTNNTLWWRLQLFF